MSLLRTLQHTLRHAGRPPTAATVTWTEDGVAPLDAAAWRAILDHVRTLGWTHLLFAGDDPLAHPDADALLTHACDGGPVLLVLPVARCVPERIGALPSVDTLAISTDVAGVDQAIVALQETRRLQPDATAEILLTVAPGDDVDRAVREADRAGALVFLTPRAAATWGRAVPAPVPGVPDAGLADQLDALCAHRPRGLMGGDRFLRDLPRALAGLPSQACVAGAGMLAVDPWGRARPCRGAEPLHQSVLAWSSREALLRDLTAERPSPCRCHFDDHDDHAVWTVDPVAGITRAARRTLLGAWRRG